MRRPSIFSNPFYMQGEEQRDVVCEAYASWWARGNATVDELCSEFKVQRANS